MPLTDVTAVWGAATGSVALSVTVWREVRDRPMLSVRLEAHMSEDRDDWLRVHVTNRGRQPTTVIDAGFVVAIKMEFENLSRPGVPSRVTTPKIRIDGGEAKVVSPGEVVTYGLPLNTWPSPIIHADFPLRAYAVDLFNNTTWSAANPWLRRLLKAGWPPPPGTDPTLLTDAGPVEPEPVEPSWKLWKPRGLRKPPPGEDKPPVFDFRPKS